MLPKRLWQASTLLALSPLSAPLVAQTGGIVVLLGADTVQVERFSRSPGRLEGTVVTRSPLARVMRYTMTVDAQGRPQRFEMATYTADGTPLRGTAQVGSIVYAGDSVVREVLQSGQTVSHRIAAPSGAVPSPVIPYLGVSFLMYEFAFARAHADAKGAAESAWGQLTMLPSLPRSQRQRVWLVGTDSAEADYFGVARSGYRFDAQGQFLRADWTGTTYKYVARRVDAFDVDAVARGWHALDQRGASFGALSPRDTARASIGLAQLLVDYSRPSKRGRPIWGSLVPWDTIWRFGADFATHFTTTGNLRVGSATVPAGAYTLWMHPSSKGPSQLVINTRVGVFGTAYPAASDLARVPLERTQLREPVERFTIAIEGGRLRVRWDDTEWSVPVALGPPDPPSLESLLATDRRASDASLQRGLRAALEAAVSDDATLLYAGAPVVRGSANVAALLRAQPLLDSLNVRWQPLSGSLSGDHSMGMTYGVTVTLARGMTDPVARIGNYATVWRWESVAGWRIVANVQVNVVPPQRAVAVPHAGPIEQPPLAAGGVSGVFVDADLAFTRRAGATDPATAFREFAAGDAVMFAANGRLLRGPADIGSAFAGNPPVDWTWYPVVADASADGTFGFTVGQSTSRPRGNAAAAPTTSKYLSIWRRDADGRAKYIFDGGNPRPLPPR
jgi:ketosteroid isomerase-like protein